MLSSHKAYVYIMQSKYILVGVCLKPGCPTLMIILYGHMT